MTEEYKACLPYYFKHRKLKKGTRPWLPYIVVSDWSGEVIAACNLKPTAQFITNKLNEEVTGIKGTDANV